ncbi:prolipoprotein diacylglyceryl transferase family protein [Paenibacillus sp.]|uniref:prolipoprotein diacylglyceryl transferase n=1 Tax=Paenibacillus sp. TaxID=58172 RepID=UPI002810FBB0|nr:prolipoprotein diacylglyceryl transferase family protein [Paenibacillus sp.]
MSFPVYIAIGSWQLHPHIVFESLSYFIGFRVYLWSRTKGGIPPLVGLQIIAGAMVGAAAGSKLLFWLEDPLLTASHVAAGDWTALLAGKTIVGGLLGGLIGVELAKKLAGWKSSTGDDFVLPLIVGMCIGRIGCFLTGLEDGTHGTPTSWPIGVDFGDGVPRHPAQLYEIAFLIGLGTALHVLRIRRGDASLPPGAVFQLFMAAYLLFRFAIDFIKPTPHFYLGLNNIQLACAAGLMYYAPLLSGWIDPKKRGIRHAR